MAAYSDDFNASLQLAGVGLGAALVPELALQRRPENVVILDVPEIRLARNIFALLINDARTARVEVFVDKLAGILQQMTSTSHVDPRP